MTNIPGAIPIYRYDPNRLDNISSNGEHQETNQQRNIPEQQNNYNPSRSPVQEPTTERFNQEGIPLQNDPNPSLYPPYRQSDSPFQYHQYQNEHNYGPHPYETNPNRNNNSGYGPYHPHRHDVIIMERSPRRSRYSWKKDKVKFNGEFFSGLVLGFFFSIYSFFCIICWPRKSFIMGVVTGVVIGLVIGLILGLTIPLSRRRRF